MLNWSSNKGMKHISKMAISWMSPKIWRVTFLISWQKLSMPSRQNGEEYNTVAKALIDKHPCLKEPGSTCGWFAWKFCLKFKMGNLRQKLRIAGSSELTVHCQKRSASGGKARTMKKPKKSEVNFLPNFPVCVCVCVCISGLAGRWTSSPVQLSHAALCAVFLQPWLWICQSVKRKCERDRKRQKKVQKATHPSAAKRKLEGKGKEMWWEVETAEPVGKTIPSRRRYAKISGLQKNVFFLILVVVFF